MQIHEQATITHTDPNCPGGEVEQSTHKDTTVLECTGCTAILFRGVSA